MRDELTLATICDGAVNERANRALQKCFDNILDPNTDPKKKREVTMRIILSPNPNDLEDISVEVLTSTKLAPEVGIKTQFYIDKDLQTGVINAVEHAKGQIKGQLSLGDMVSNGFMPAQSESTVIEPDGTAELTTESLEATGTSNVIDMRRARKNTGGLYD